MMPYYEAGKDFRSCLRKRYAQNEEDGYSVHRCSLLVDLMTPSDDELWLLRRYGRRDFARMEYSLPREHFNVCTASTTRC